MVFLESCLASCLLPLSPRTPSDWGSHIFLELCIPLLWVGVRPIGRIRENLQYLLRALEYKEEGSFLVLQNALYHRLFKPCWPGHFSRLSGFRNLSSRKRPQAPWSPVPVTLVGMFPLTLLSSMTALQLACKFFLPGKYPAKVGVRTS